MPSNQNNVDAKTWLANFSKSIAYSTKNLVTQKLMPETSGHISTVAESVKEIRQNIRQNGTGMLTSAKAVDHSAIGREGIKLFKDIMNDLRTGKFSIPKDDFFDDIGIDMDFSVTDIEDDDGATSQIIEVSNDAKLTSQAVIEGANVTSEAIGRMTRSMLKSNAKTAKLQAEMTKNMAIMINNTIGSQLIGTNQRLDVLNTTTATILSFLKENQATLNEAAMKHFSRMEEAMAMQMRLISGDTSRKKKSLSDELKSDGFDMQKYMDLVKKNVKNNSMVSTLSTMISMGSMMGSMSGMAGGMNSMMRPTDMLLQMILGSIIPKNTRNRIKAFDKSIPRSINLGLTKLGEQRNASGWKGVLAEIFGYDTSKAAKVNLGGYDKGAVAWDGNSKKALEEVIPFYLSRIDAGINREDAMIYDYKSGTFKTKKVIAKEMDDQITGDIQRIFNPLLQSFESMLKTSSGKFRGDSENDFQNMKKELGRIVSDSIKSGTKSNSNKVESDLREAIANQSKLSKVLAPSQINELVAELVGSIGKFKSGAGKSEMNRRYAKDSDSAAIRYLLSSGAIESMLMDEDGEFDILSPLLGDDIFTKDTSFAKKYAEAQKKKKEREMRDKKLIDDANLLKQKSGTREYLGTVDRTGIKGKAKTAFNRATIKLGGGGERDDRMMHKVEDVEALFTSFLSGRAFRDMKSEDGIMKSIKNAINTAKMDMHTDQNFAHPIPVNSVRKMMDAAKLDTRCYEIHTYEINGIECFEYAELVNMLANDDSWKTYPTLLTPDMFNGNKLDLTRVKSYYQNEDAEKRSTTEAKVVEPERPKAPKSTGKEDTAGKVHDRPVQGSSGHNQRQHGASVQKTSGSSDSSSDSDGGGDADPTVEASIKSTVSDGVKNVGGAFASMTAKIKEASQNIYNYFMGGMDSAAKDNADEMEKTSAKMQAADSASEMKSGRGKSILKIALGGIVAGIVGKKVFNKKNLGLLAAATSIAGPIGVGIVGLGTAILATKVDFRRMILGQENTDADGNLKKKKKKASLLERIYNGFKVNVLDELKVGVKGYLAEMGAFTKKTLAAPLKRAFSPISKGLATIGDAAKESVKGAVGNIGNKILGGVSKLAGANHGIARKGIRFASWGARRGTEAAIGSMGLVARALSNRRKNRDYKQLGGDNWKDTRSRIEESTDVYLQRIKDEAGENPTNESLEAAYQTVLNEIPDGPDGDVLKANITEAYEQEINNRNYKDVRQSTRNMRYVQNYREKAMRMSGNDLDSLTDKQIAKLKDQMGTKRVWNFGDLSKDDKYSKTFQRAKENDEDFIQFLKDPEKMAKIFDKRDKDAAEKAEAEAKIEAEKKETKRWRGGIWSMIGGILNAVSMGRISPPNLYEAEDSVISEVQSGSMNETEYADQTAVSQAVIQENEQEMLDKQSKEIASDASEEAEEASTEAQGSVKTRKGGFVRKIKNFFSRDKDSDEDDGEKKESKGILSTITDGFKSIFSNPTLIAGIGASIDLLFNDGKILDFLIDGADKILAALRAKLIEKSKNGIQKIWDSLFQWIPWGHKNGGGEVPENAVVESEGKILENAADNPMIVTDDEGNAVVDEDGNVQIKQHRASEAVLGGVTSTAGWAMHHPGAVKTMAKVTGKGLGMAAKGVGRIAGGVAKGVIKRLPGGKAALAVGSWAGKGIKQLGSTIAEKAPAMIPKAKTLAVNLATGAKKKWTKIVDFLKSGIEALSKSSLVKKFFGNETISKIIDFLKKNVVDKLSKVSDSLLSKFSKKITEGAAEATASTVKAVPILGWAITGAQAVYNGVTGALEAANLFQVSEDQVDGTMRGVSAVLKVLLDLIPVAGPAFDVISEIWEALTGFDIKNWMATKIYELIENWLFKDDEGHVSLSEKQAQFEEEYKKYLEENGLSEDDVSELEYNDMRNQSGLSKIVSGTKNFFSNLFGGAKKDVEESAVDAAANAGSGIGSSKSSSTKSGNSKAKIKTIAGNASAGYGFRQADPRWANMKTGRFKNGQPATMKNAGCGFAAMSTVDRLFGGNSTPDQVARKAMSRGDVADGGATGSLFEKGINGVHGTPIGDSRTMASSLKRGQPVVISGQAGYGIGPNVFPRNNKHLVVGRGMDANGNVIIDNPMYGTQRVPFSQIASQTKAAWAMHKGSAGYGVGDKANEDYVYMSQINPSSNKNVSIGPGINLYNHGCVATSAAMATSMLSGQKVDPIAMAQNVFAPTSTGNGFTGSTWNTLKNKYGIDSQEYGRTGGSPAYQNGSAEATMQKAVDAVKQGKPVALHGSPNLNAMASWSGTKQDSPQHNILAYGMDDNGNFLIADPSDTTGGKRGKVTAAHIAPGDLINGLRWIRVYEKDGKGIDKNMNMTAIANMAGSPVSEDGDTTSSSSSSGSSGILDVFSKLGSGLAAIAGNAFNAIIGGTEYKRAIDDSGNVIGQEPMDGTSQTENAAEMKLGKAESAKYGKSSEEVASIVNNSTYSTFDNTTPPYQGTFAASFDPAKAKFLNQDLGQFNPVTADQLNQYLSTKTREDSVFIGRGEDIINASNATGLDPRYILAHSGIETGWGTSSQAKNKNNYFGIEAYNDDPSKAKSFDGNGFLAGAQWIKDKFYTPGQKTLAEMLIGKEGHSYATYDEANFGRSGPNYHWANQIAGQMESMGFGPGSSAKIISGLRPTGYGFTNDSANPVAGVENRLDTLIDLVGVIAERGSSGYGNGEFVNNAGYGNANGGAKESIQDLKTQKQVKDIQKHAKERSQNSQNDLGRSRLLSIHNAIASGYRGRQTTN